jgi:hypothetical protein
MKLYLCKLSITQISSVIQKDNPSQLEDRTSANKKFSNVFLFFRYNVSVGQIIRLVGIGGRGLAVEGDAAEARLVGRTIVFGGADSRKFNKI